MSQTSNIVVHRRDRIRHVDKALALLRRMCQEHGLLPAVCLTVDSVNPPTACLVPLTTAPFAVLDLADALERFAWKLRAGQLSIQEFAP